ncbi:LOW QUALITY PROTEIN: aldehyde oxidase GLOX [Cryptomeria japonica]|uniref:LOW QUALITY PROTEIN: aldehyde oxidase GLOX n=1 Tax=Cryptomeria japonica TaxID=3369 RepID=UPI0027DA31FE|nr:LOW QUALITY PROTEIN: aldehyde oxidase GLOX [Cryptomeria japonica]
MARMIELVLCVVFLWAVSVGRAVEVKPGSWKLVVSNGGVSAMHMTTTYEDTVIMFDRTDYGASKLLLDKGRCRNDANDLALKHDCWAHSIEYNIASNSLRPLMVMTDTWCSCASFAADGTLVSTGGYNDGGKAVRYFQPCNNSACDWNDSQPTKLAENRWYSSTQILPDNRVIVVGGRRAFSYEFVPKKVGESYYNLPFLMQTFVVNVENNLYPFLHLSSDGNLFIFANKDSILLDYKTNRVVKKFPTMLGGARNYPSCGSSVMLALTASDGFRKVEILICGGAPDNSFTSANQGNFLPALQSCGRIVITDANPGWAMENMPSPRVLSDMLILPNGEILIINGAKQGTAGWELGRDPALAPFLYKPNSVPGYRFSTLAPSTIPRMYHSSASVLPDGRILVGGSNPHVGYVLSGIPYPTELRLEAYSPYYLDSSFVVYRPTIVALSSSSLMYGKSSLCSSLFSVTLPTILRSISFTTHSFSMNQRLLILAANSSKSMGGKYFTEVTAPPNSVTAPAGYYMLFVVNNGIPSVAKWIHLS